MAIKKTQENIDQRFNVILNDQLCFMEPTSKLETLENKKLDDDLGADSLDKVEIIIELETAFDIHIDDIEAEEALTYGQLLSLVKDCITKQQ